MKEIKLEQPQFPDNIIGASCNCGKPNNCNACGAGICINKCMTGNTVELKKQISDIYKKN